MHRVIEPKIHYYGTPVVLVASLNEDDTSNLAPNSSCWWLGQQCVLGIATRSKSFANLQRHGEVVLNLMSADLAEVVDRLALTTGSDPVPEYKRVIGTEFVKDKFAHASLTPVASDRVRPHRVAESPIALEGRVQAIHAVGTAGHHAAVEIRIVRTHVDDALIAPTARHHIDPTKWRPLIMSFLELFTVTAEVHESRLARVF